MNAPDPNLPAVTDEEVGPLARRKRAQQRASGGEDLPPGPVTRASYYAGSASWAEDSLAGLRASQKVAWRVAIAAGLLAFLLAIAIVIMLPLNKTLPFLVTVDRETGYVQATQTANIANTTARDAATKSALTLYVLARETFDSGDYRNNYQRTLRWSAGRAEAEYRTDWDRNNPNSVHTRYRPTTRVQVTVKNVTILSPNTAMVRFDTEQTEGPQTGGSRRPWVATLTYNFAPRPLPGADQYLNPLGFQVTDYRRDGETTDSFSMPAPPLPPAPAPVAPAATIDPVTGLPVTAAAPGNPGQPQVDDGSAPVDTPPTGIGGMETADPTQEQGQ